MDPKTESSPQLKRKDRGDPQTDELKSVKIRSSLPQSTEIQKRRYRSGTSGTRMQNLLTEAEGTFEILETHRTLSNVPDQSVIVHSTNCLAIWGPSFASALKHKYPVAEKVYTRHCNSFVPANSSWPKKEGLVGTSLLIPPQKEKEGTPKVWIACLFASYSYGNQSDKKPGKDNPADITSQTRTALEQLQRQLKTIEEGMYEVRAVQPSPTGPILHHLHFYEFERSKQNESSDTPQEQKHSSYDGTHAEDTFRHQTNQDYKVRSRGKDQHAATPAAIRETKCHGAEACIDVLPPSMCIYSPRINGGNFDVPWDVTQRMIGDIFGAWQGKWFILSARDAKSKMGLVRNRKSR